MALQPLSKMYKRGIIHLLRLLQGTFMMNFHAAILPLLKAKKGNTYAENIHSKYDELQDAVTSKNNTKIAELIKVNRDNHDTVGKILGVSLK